VKALESRLEADYWAAFRATDHQVLHERAGALVASGESTCSEAYHSALFVLLHHGELARVKEAIEAAMAADGACAPSLLPVLAHVYQRLQDLRTAHQLFEQCRQRGLLIGRNAFLARTADAVAFSAAYESDDAAAVTIEAKRFLASCDAPSSELFHAAVCALVSRGEVGAAKAAIDVALTTDYEGCSASLLPLLAHIHQRMDDLRTSHELFEQCVARELLTGRNAFLTQTAAAVAFSAAYESDDETAVVPQARRFVDSCDAPSSELFHAAVCALLSRGEIADARRAVEKALTADFDGCVRLLLPVLAHIHQRLYDIETAHALFEACDRLKLFTGKNAFLAGTATDVAHAYAELVMHRARAAEERDDDSAAFVAGRVVARALYENGFAAARARAGNTAPAVVRSRRGARKPDFIIAGSAKCGTTYLYDLLTRSPSVWKRAPKELHYFTSMYRFGDAFYSTFFELCPEALTCGESSPDYLDDCTAERPVDERIQACCPDVRIIVVLRDPALRAISWYNQMTTNDGGRGGRPGNQRLNDLTMDQLRTYRNGNSLRQGLFIEPLRRFRRTFGQDRLLVLPFSDLVVSDRASSRVSSFLHIEPPALDVGVPPRQNAGGHDRPSDALYGALRDYYRESLAALEDEFGIRL